MRDAARINPALKDDASRAESEAVLAEARALIDKSGLTLTDANWAGLVADDFGLGRLRVEGFVFVDLVRSERLRVTLLVLLPNQTLPEHCHPPYGTERGKEETLRCLWGETRVVVPGETTPGLSVPIGKETFYTARRAVTLYAGGQFTVLPATRHWFQAGPIGSVNLAFQNRVDENHNVFTESGSRCPVPSENS